MNVRLPCFFVLILLPLVLPAATPILSLKDVRPGLKGEALTVFSGTKIQPFQFEVMGIAKDFIGPGHDVIWCKMTSDPTGMMVIAHGMSGSPCYINGKLMGALAYGWEFSKEPIFGVQPIESMLEVLALKENKPVASRSSQPPTEMSTIKSLAGLKPAPILSSKARAQMLQPPLEISGLNPHIADRVMQAWSESGFFPQMAAGGGASKLADAADLVPGAAATGVIAEGDLSIAATGTLTWRDGDRILAFGHPFLDIGVVDGIGAVEIPLGKAEIVAILPNYKSSTKMANQGSVVGSLTQDRLTAVGGVIGKTPRMTPMSVTVRWPDATRSWKLRFCDNKFFTPMVYQTALIQFLAGVMERTEEVTLTLQSTIEFEGLPPLRFEDEFTGERYAWLFDAVMLPAWQLVPMYQNDFETPRVKSISVDIKVMPSVQRASIEEMTAQPLEAHPGDTIHVHAGFQPWHGKRFYKDYDVVLPEEAKSGEVELILADANRADQLTGTLAGAGVLSSGSAPRDMRQLIAALNKRHRHDSLHLVLQKKAAGLQVQDQRLTSLPESVQKLLLDDQSADHPTQIQDAILSETTIDFGSVVEGSRSVKIKIK